MIKRRRDALRFKPLCHDSSPTPGAPLERGPRQPPSHPLPTELPDRHTGLAEDQQRAALQRVAAEPSFCESNQVGCGQRIIWLRQQGMPRRHPRLGQRGAPLGEDRLRDRLRSVSQGMKTGLDVVLVSLGALVFSGFDRSIEPALVNASPQWLTDLTTRF